MPPCRRTSADSDDATKACSAHPSSLKPSRRARLQRSRPSKLSEVIAAASPPPWRVLQDSFVAVRALWKHCENRRRRRSESRFCNTLPCGEGQGRGSPIPQMSGFPPPLTPPRKGEGNPTAAVVGESFHPLRIGEANYPGPCAMSRPVTSQGPGSEHCSRAARIAVSGTSTGGGTPVTSGSGVAADAAARCPGPARACPCGGS